MKIILTAYRLNAEDSSRIILGHELDYKTINDNLFIEHVHDNLASVDIYTTHRYLKKLVIISEKRFPQIFLFYAKYPNLLKSLAEKVCVADHESLPQLPEDL